MSTVALNQAFIIFGLILIMIELFLNLDTGFDLLVLGTITIFSGFIGLLFGSFWLALALVGLASLAYFLFLRKKFKQKVVIPMGQAYSLDAVVGQKAIVTTEILSTKAGKVKINGQIWRARSRSRLKPREKVKVEKIKGITLFVKKLKTNQKSTATKK